MMASRIKRWALKRAQSGPHITLDRRVIYIFPSAAGWGFIGFILLLLLLAINYQNNLAYAVCFTLGAVFVVSILHTYATLAGLRVEALEAKPVFVGQELGFGYRLKASKRAVGSVSLRLENQARSCSLEAGESRSVQLFLPALQRGWQSRPALCIESYYPLGLLRAWSWANIGKPGLVYCKPSKPSQLPAAAVTDESGSQSRGPMVAGSEQFDGLRDYREGDLPSRIAWKKLAAGQGLVVREFAEQQGQQRWLDVDSWPGPFELRLSQVTWQALQMHSAGQPFGLILAGRKWSCATGEGHLGQVLKALALAGHKG